MFSIFYLKTLNIFIHFLQHLTNYDNLSYSLIKQDKEYDLLFNHKKLNFIF